MSARNWSTIRGHVANLSELIFGAGVAAGLTFCYFAWTARKVGPAEYADFSAAVSIIYVVALALAPVQPLVARVITRLRERGEQQQIILVRRRLAGIALVTSAVCLPLFACLAFALWRILRFRSAFVPALALAIPVLFMWVSLDRGMLQGLGRFRAYTVSIVLEATLRLLGGASLLLLAPVSSMSLAAYGGALAVSEGVLAVDLRESWRAVKSAVSGVDWTEARKLAGPLFVMSLTAAVFQNVDMLGVKRWFPAETAGMYGAAVALARGIGVIFVPIYVYSGPMLTALDERKRSLLAPTLGLCGMFTAVAIVPAMVLLWKPDVVMNLLYGREYAAAGWIVAPVAGIYVLNYNCLILAQALITEHAHGFLVWWVVGTLLDIGAIVFVHGTVVRLLVAHAAVQGILLIGTAVLFLRASKRRPAVESTS